MTAGLLAGRYRPVALLGKGSMGEVWHVVDEAAGRTLALKLVAAETAERKLALRQEFRVLARLRHPNLVAVEGYGELADGTPYLAMQLVPGEDVDARLTRGRLPWDLVLAILLGATQALAFIHDRGLLHRDLKPANLRLQPDGTPTLMDFGLAGPIGLVPRGITGTPGYMAPEAIRGEPLGPASDMYALGCLAYELVAGVPPFEGEPREVLAAHLRRAPLPLTAFRPDVPPPLQALTDALMAKEAAQRPAGADEVLRALAELAGVAATQATASQRQSYLASAPLTGRDAELAQLNAAWARARAGEGQAVVVAAAGGVGKTRLVDAQLVDCTLDHGAVVRVACPEADLSPYAALAVAVQGLAASLGPPPPALAGLAEGGPDGPRAGAGGAPGGAPPPEATEVGRALAAWLSGAGPVALVLEDLHQADPGTVAAFCACARTLAAAPCLLIGTVRPEELPAGHQVWALATDGTVTWLALQPFDPTAFQALLAATLGQTALPERLVAALFEATGGVPCSLATLLREMVAQELLVRHLGTWLLPPADTLAVPASATEAFLSRLERLPEPARRLAGLAAVLGAAPTRASLLALGGLPEAACFDALDALAQAGLLIGGRDALRFVPERAREALYDMLPEADRRAWHRACAAHLATTGAGPAVLARHHEAAGGLALAGPCYLRAADEAQAANLPLAAFSYRVSAERCLMAADTADAPTLARLRWQAGLGGFSARPREAMALLERLAEQLEGESADLGPELPTRLEALMILTAACGLAGSPDRARTVAAEAQALLTGPDDPLWAVWYTVGCAGLLAAGHIDALRRATDQGRAVVRGLPTGPHHPLIHRAQVGLCGYQNARAYLGHPPDPAIEAEAMALTEALGAPATGGVIRHYRGIWLAWSGRVVELEAFVAREEELARALGGAPHAVVPYVRACAAWLRGEPRAALALVGRARQLGATVEPLDGYMAALEARLLAAVGEPTRGAALAAEVAARAADAGLSLAQAMALLARGAIALALGEGATARDALTTARALTAAGAEARNPGCEASALRLLAEVALGEGQLGEAEGWLLAADACLADPGLDLALERGELARVRGAWAARSGDGARAREAFEAAARRFREVGSLPGLHAVQQALRDLTPAQAASSDDWDALEAWLADEVGAEATPGP
ncbi:MAG: protein kinase [Candidatus Sericytochromatia bacterium]|nr:protein kinase [Candidatus Sericytochromatia bacterium]